jgi:hypothetical protein
MKCLSSGIPFPVGSRAHPDSGSPLCTRSSLRWPQRGRSQRTELDGAGMGYESGWSGLGHQPPDLSWHGHAQPQPQPLNLPTFLLALVVRSPLGITRSHGPSSQKGLLEGHMSSESLVQVGLSVPRLAMGSWTTSGCDFSFHSLDSGPFSSQAPGAPADPAQVMPISGESWLT